jgi:hypothetical protein
VTVIIPGSVSSIGDSAFDRNSDLVSVRFLGAAPTITTSSFGLPEAGKVLYYPVGRPVYGSPTWFGYTTQAYATVTFDARGGAPAADEQYIDVGGTVAEPAGPSRARSVFAGWHDGTSLYDFDSPVVDNLTLVATYSALALAAAGPSAPQVWLLVAALFVVAGAGIRAASLRRSRRSV